MYMRISGIIALILVVLTTSLTAQEKGKTVCNAVVEGEDTVACVVIPTAVISDKKTWNRKYYKRYNRIQPKVVKVYPYAKAAGDIMNQYAAHMETIESKKGQRQFMNDAEDELKSQFEGELRQMTVSEGMLLIKLIDRETGESSYELVQELKGNFSAFMWQSLARLFGHNLKDDYDAEGDEAIIEEVVRQIESGEIKVQSKPIELRSDLLSDQ